MRRIKILTLLILSVPFSVSIAQTGNEVEQENPVILYSGTPKRYEIADITVTGDDQNAKTLKNLSGLSVGQRLAVPGPEISNAMKRLWKNGLFSNVRILATRISGDKIWLEIEVVHRPKLKECVFHGIKKGEVSELEEKLKLIPGTQVTPNVLNRSEALIRKYYDEKGYKDADVRIQQRTEVDEDGLVYVDIYIDRKDKVKVRQIHIEGNEVLSDREIRKIMKKTNEKGYLPDFFHTKKFVNEEFLGDMDKIRDRYGELGYRDAYIVKDSVSGNPEDNTVDIWLTLDEGGKYYLRDVRWVGNTVYNSEALSDVLKMKKGDVYNQKKLDERTRSDEDAIQRHYYNGGYVMAQISPVEANVEGDSIDLEIRISEGAQHTINRVNIYGNDRV